MHYEMVHLPEKKVIGLSARTNNASPDMSSVISSLWQNFYKPDCYPVILDKVNDKALGIYTDYASKENGDYTVITACEVSRQTVPFIPFQLDLTHGLLSKEI